MMAKITLEVSEELAAQLAQIGDRVAFPLEISLSQPLTLSLQGHHRQPRSVMLKLMSLLTSI
jgi:hypothetical protein